MDNFAALSLWKTKLQMDFHTSGSNQLLTEILKIAMVSIYAQLMYGYKILQINRIIPSLAGFNCPLMILNNKITSIL